MYDMLLISIHVHDITLSLHVCNILLILYQVWDIILLNHVYNILHSPTICVISSSSTMCEISSSPPTKCVISSSCPLVSPIIPIILPAMLFPTVISVISSSYYIILLHTQGHSANSLCCTKYNNNV